MKIIRPHHVQYLIDLRKKINQQKLEENMLSERSASASILLAEKLAEIFDDSDYYASICNTVKNEDSDYFTLKLLDKQDIASYKEIEFNPFEENTEYDFTTPGELWRLIIDVFEESGKYNNDSSKAAFIKRMSYYGFDIQDSPRVNNDTFEIEFKILEIVPKYEPEANDDNSEISYEANDFELSPEELYYESMQNFIDTIFSFFLDWKNRNNN